MQLSSAMLRAIRGILGVCIVLGATGESAAGAPQRFGWYVDVGVGANWSSTLAQEGHNRDTICYPDEDCSHLPVGMTRRLSLELRPGAGYRRCGSSFNRPYVRQCAPGIVGHPAGK